jgi:TetR/AcrR family transcriptional repressor of mexJK operon
MDVVAKKAGISKASLYGSFPSKDDLYRAVVTDWVDRGADAMRPHVATLLTATDLRTALLDLVQTLQAGILSPDVLAMRSLVSTEAARHPDIAIMYATNSWERNTAMLGDALAELHERGTLNIPDPSIAADQLTWLAVGSPLNQHELTAGARTMPANRLHDIATAAVEAFLLAYAP